jgi:hypothetical protein
MIQQSGHLVSPPFKKKPLPEMFKIAARLSVLINLQNINKFWTPLC